MTPPDGSRSSLSRSVAMVWRTLRSMRTAIILLLMTAAAAVVGSLIPQIPNSPERVAAYRLDHPLWGDVVSAGGFFDVFGSWWFGLIIALLFVSLIACLLPRSRALWRAARARPIQARELDAFPSFAEHRVAAAPADAAVGALKTLRRKRYRVALDPDGPALAAEKGFLREIGSLAFHWAFLVLLVAVIIGKGTGYIGHATIVEGETWVDARLNYDGDLRTGRFFAGGFSGTEITLVDFEDSYRETGIPMDFHSLLRLAGAGGTDARDVDVRINHPSLFNGIRIFQYGFGWAVMMQVRAGDRMLFDGPVVLGQDTPPGENPLAQPWVGVIKLRDAAPAAGDRARAVSGRRGLLPFVANRCAATDDAGQRAVRPVTRCGRGSCWTPRFRGSTRVSCRLPAPASSGEGGTVDLDRDCVVADPGTPTPAGLDVVCSPPPGPKALLMSFPELRQYSRLQISHDATIPYVLAAAILIVLGLLPALYVSRRKVWVRARPDGSGSIVQVGGFALQRKDRFDDEFVSLVDAIVTAAGGAPTEEPAEAVRP